MEAQSLLKMKVNIKLVQQHLTSTGRVVILKDITNMQTQVNAAKGDGNNLNAVVSRLREIEGNISD